MNPPLRMMVIGSFPPPTGGTSVSLLHLVTALHARGDVQPAVVDLSGIRSAGASVATARRFWEAMSRIDAHARKCDVITMHLNTSALSSAGTAILFIARRRRVPVILRKFGGTDHLEYLKGPDRFLARRVVHGVDLYLAQTKSLVESARRDGVDSVAWYPTNRPMDNGQAAKAARDRPCRSFVYLGLIRRSKGVGQILEVAELFARHSRERIHIHFYGPLMDGFTPRSFSGLDNVSYHGSVPPTEVIAVLRRHDALLLPTFHAGEGYPGVILEAYQAGLPVITSRWMSIPEIVDETCGELIAPRDPVALLNAVRRLVEDRDHYARLSAGALIKRESFDTGYWTQQLVRHAERLLMPGCIHK